MDPPSKEIQLNKAIGDLTREIKELSKEIKEKEETILILMPGDVSDLKRKILVDSLGASRTRLQTMEEQKLVLLRQQGQQANKSDKGMNEHVKSVVFNWAKTEADPFGLAGLKRKRESGEESDIEATPGNAGKKQRGLSGDTIPVETLPPIEDGSWYLGTGSRHLFVRRCVKDLGMALMKEILDESTRKECATCYVISGAPGIGKSWSINAFVTELLRNGLAVFFHNGSSGHALLLSKEDGEVSVTSVDAPDIEDMFDPHVVYVYDSPGSKVKPGSHHSQARVRNNVGVSLIFSPPKIDNYDYATSKTNGIVIVKNLPTWSNPEMRSAKHTERADVVDRCYSVWGGNMQALDRFIHLTNKNGIEAATIDAVKQLDAQIRCIDRKLADRMSKELEKQQVTNSLGADDYKNAPGHILMPEPINKDPRDGECFEEFVWRFCSPMAERKFMVHAKTLGSGVLMALLKSVFDVPSPKRVLFEKVAHFLITNGLVRQFRWCSYNDKKSESVISFPECNVINFETDKLKEVMKEQLQKLAGKPKGVAVALEPISPSFDAVDMFVLVRQDEKGTAMDWRLYLLQDTIARKHSLHPVKVLWYCALFVEVFKEVLPEAGKTGPVLDCCRYVPVVPHQSKDSFEFEKPESNLKKLDDIDQVAKLLDVQWPKEYKNDRLTQRQLKAFMKKMNLEIPHTTRGKEKAPSKPVVGNTILNGPAAKKVKEMSFVIFDVLK